MQKSKLILIFALFALIMSSNFTYAAKDKKKKEAVEEKQEGKRPFTFEDVMKFRAMRFPIISDDGKWTAFCAIPDRGDQEAIVQSNWDSTKYIIERGNRPVISKLSGWVAASVLPKAIELENAKSAKDKPKNGLALLNLNSGKQIDFQNVASFDFSNDDKWLAYKSSDEDTKKDEKKNKDKAIGTTLVLRHLSSGTEIKMDNVKEYTFDSTSSFLFYIVSTRSGDKDGVYYRALNQEFAPEFKITKNENTFYTELAWNKKESLLAFLSAELKDNGKPKECTLMLWNPLNKDSLETIVALDQVPTGWFIHSKNSLKWTKDGARLFFGLKPFSQQYPDDEDKFKYNDKNFFNADSIQTRAEVQVWHWNDPLIKSNEKTNWDKTKDKTYLSVYSLTEKKMQMLGDTNLPDVDIAENPNFTVAHSSVPYLKERTWYGDKFDLYLVNLKTGERKLIEKELEEPGRISPDGASVVYFKGKHWFVYNVANAKSENVTQELDFTFEDKELDVPSNPRSCGFGGWYEYGKGVMIYDNYDTWIVELAPPHTIICLSGGEGRINNQVYRLWNPDKNREYYSKDSSLIYTAFDKNKKTMSILEGSFKIYGVNTVVPFSNKRFNLIAKAEKSDKILMTRESFEEFPDLIVADRKLKELKKISDVNPQMKEFIWGTTELVSWVNSRGDSIQGYIIKPDNYDPNKKYPVLVYFYEQMTDRTYSFTQPVLTHRPVYQVYLGSGYLIFVPDIKYYVGNPGFDALDCLLSGSRKLVSMGIADSSKFCIQGHSWGGYQTAFVVTQTDFFKAAGAGAPVANMTSAYSQVRLESGLSRQFQYEAQQSRIGGSLLDSLDNYIRNSPIFSAKKMNTPFLIEFGDVDEAVPWQQGLELYMVMRRYNRNAVMLQYENEPHWPRRYQNKVDYSVKMKEFFDHYILGAPAKDWFSKGLPYIGK